jgi:hypothetical protein
MARVKDCSYQANLWGVAGNKSPNAQRSDLWSMDLAGVVKGLNDQIKVDKEAKLTPVESVEPYFVQSVTLPELKVNAEPFKRDSRSYMMPMHDEPLGAITVKFYLETPRNPQRSVVYHLLDNWRAYVRGGRGPLTGERWVPSLGADWMLVYAFDVSLILYRGCSVPKVVDFYSSSTDDVIDSSNRQALAYELSKIKDPVLKAKRLQAVYASGENQGYGVSNDLEKCGTILLESCWLSSFKLSDLNHQQGNQLVTIDATLYADNIRDLTGW